MKRWFGLLFAAVLVPYMLTACGNGDDMDIDVDEEITTPASMDTPEPLDTVEPVTEPMTEPMGTPTGMAPMTTPLAGDTLTTPGTTY